MFYDILSTCVSDCVLDGIILECRVVDEDFVLSSSFDKWEGGTKG
jgi:hypothetical protein